MASKLPKRSRPVSLISPYLHERPAIWGVYGVVSVPVSVFTLLAGARIEWVVNQHRDSIASYAGHDNLLSYFAVVENETKARVKFNLLQKILQPCGSPPEKREDF